MKLLVIVGALGEHPSDSRVQGINFNDELPGGVRLD